MFSFFMLLLLLRRPLLALADESSKVTIAKDEKRKLCEEEKIIDHLSFEAIKTLHKSMDDDSSGSVDVAESLEFVREELHITERDRVDKRKKAFHHNTDSIITVDDLWCRWVHSDERKWTTEEMVQWLEQSLELPQYRTSFISHHLTGSMLPRISLQSSNFLFTILGISNPVHRQKIQLKAMDVVLFGQRSTKTNYVKDVILLSLLCIAVGGYWFAVNQRSAAQQEAIRLSSQMDKLKDIEQNFLSLQEKFNEEKHKNEMCEKQSEAGSSDKEEQIEHLKNQLLNAEKLWEKRNPQLSKLLRKTYDLEMHRINQQKVSSIRKMTEAREMVEKYKKKRSSLFSQIRSVHIEDMESIDQEIMALKQKLEETAYAIEECQQRWTQIENLSGFSIVLPSPVAGNHVPNHVAGLHHFQSSACLSSSTTNKSAISPPNHSIAAAKHNFSLSSINDNNNVAHFRKISALSKLETFH